MISASAFSGIRLVEDAGHRGIAVRGRTQTLKITYRTSHQTKQMAGQLLPAAIRDVDGMEEDRSGTVSSSSRFKSRTVIRRDWLTSQRRHPSARKTKSWLEPSGPEMAECRARKSRSCPRFLRRTGSY